MTSIRLHLMAAVILLLFTSCDGGEEPSAPTEEPTPHSRPSSTPSASPTSAPSPTPSPANDPELVSPFSGYYASGFEQSLFSPNGDCFFRDPRWWLTAEPDSGFNERFIEVVGEVTLSSQFVWVSFEGEVSEPGMWGHLGSGQREVTVTGVLEMRAAPECEM